VVSGVLIGFQKRLIAAFVLYSFQIAIPICKIIPKNKNKSQNEKWDSELSLGIVEEKFTTHPCRIAQNPSSNSQVMKQIRPIKPRFPCKPARQQKCWQRHTNTQPLYICKPREVFYQPKYDMKIFFPSKINCHESKIIQFAISKTFSIQPL
jgi:hypothetical protein